MDTRRFRKDSHSHRLAQARWLGWVMLMMFVLVQTATGAANTGDRSKDFTAQSRCSAAAGGESTLAAFAVRPSV